MKVLKLLIEVRAVEISLADHLSPGLHFDCCDIVYGDTGFTHSYGANIFLQKLLELTEFYVAWVFYLHVCL